jgi:hypothetical protein
MFLFNYNDRDNGIFVMCGQITKNRTFMNKLSKKIHEYVLYLRNYVVYLIM